MKGEAMSVGRWAAVVALVMAVAASGVQVAMQAQSMRQAFADLAAAQERHDALLAEYTRLLLERGMLSSYRNVGDTASEALAMRFPETFTEVRRLGRGPAMNLAGAQP